MKETVRHAILPLFVVFATMQTSALAEHKPSAEALFEVALDIDNDGTVDRAAVTQDPESGQADLYIYLSAEGDKLDLSRPPSFLKKGLTTERVSGLESNGNGSLIVRYGCGGCSNDYETALTIVHRDAGFLVAGFTYDWDTREGIGSCDINFLTKKGVTSRGLKGESKPIRGKFRPVKLADWSHEDGTRVCGF